jgi:hypothetical protein
MRYVDGDALFTFRLESIGELTVIDLAVSHEA